MAEMTWTPFEDSGYPRSFKPFKPSLEVVEQMLDDEVSAMFPEEWIETAFKGCDEVENG